MSISSRITSMEQHIGNAYDKLDELGVDLTNVDKNLNNIAELLDGVYEDYPKTTTTNVTEPSINNTKVGKMEIDLKGNTEQNTYTGKNLLKPDKNLTPSTMEGITFTPVYKDGILKRIDITGTSTGRAYYYLQSTNQPFGDVSGNITVSITGTASGINLNQDNYIDNIYKASQIASGTVKATYNPSNLGYTQYRDYINVPFTTPTTYNTSVYPMFEQGETATSYEPYTGETASPNPDYPQDVEVVTGENTVKVVNKNLFNENDATKTSISNDGVESSNIHYLTSNYINTTPTTVYYFSTTQKSGQTAKQIYICYYNKNKEFVSRTSYNLYESDFTTPANCYYMRAGVYTTGQENIMLELGSTETTYEEHKEQDFPISLSSRNLFDKNTETVGWVYSSTGTWAEAASWNTSDWIQVNSSNQYKLSSKTTGTSNLFFSEFDINKQFIQRTTTANLTPAVNTKYIRLSYKNDLGTYDIQIEQGSTATEYQPYYNYELCKIGDYQDYIYKNNGSWYIKKNISKVVLDGSEDEGWTINTSTTAGGAIFSIAVNNISELPNAQTQGTVRCQYYTPATPSSTWGQLKNGITNLNGAKYIRIRHLGITVLADYKTWLSTHNIIVYYVLATAQDIEITDTTLISQLNALEKAKSYDDTTNVIQENNDLPFILDIKTLKKS